MADDGSVFLTNAGVPVTEVPRFAGDIPHSGSYCVAQYVGHWIDCLRNQERPEVESWGVTE